MNTPQELYAKLELNQNDITSIIAIWSEANEAEKQYTDIKKYALVLVDQYLQTNNLTKGKTDIGSFGYTQPKPKLVLNTTKWENAVRADNTLFSLQTEFNILQQRLEQARKDFYEEVIPESRPYIK